MAGPVNQQTFILQCRKQQKLFDADCLSSNFDGVSQTEGTGIRSRGKFVARRTPLGNVNDSFLSVSTHDTSGPKHGIQMNSVSDFGVTL